jgi:RNA polymerase sigma-70 factor (ECF subfamily)
VRRWKSAGGVDDDRRLVESAQKGDRTAFDLLVLKYQHRVVKLANRYVRDPEEALDVAQEAFLRAYRALPGFRGESAFYSWLYRITINTAHNHLAARRARREETGVGEDRDEGDLGVPLEDRVQDLNTPEAMLLSDEIRRTIERAVEELPEDLRTAIVLREVEGLSYEDIARIMDCPIGTVRSRIFRAREAINARIEPLLR